ncbi:MAG: protoporphyrinogen oxidase [Actinomycetota bacterium]|jgi:oxygen-dependent protoporphyrinogen oxidase
MTREAPHVVVVGGGITGLTAAFRLVGSGLRVSLLEAHSTVGGKVRTGSFAGLDHVEEGPDAYLARVPHAVRLARDLGLPTTNPRTGHAAVFHGTLHRIPEGLVLGVPSDIGRLASSDLLSARAKLRAAIEPLLPRTDPHDSIGDLVRRRFGDQVHERLVDPLVGSIYATDTDRFSLEMVPQLAELARSRSLVLAARRRSRAVPQSGPVFETPAAGLGSLIGMLRSSVERAGGTVTTSCAVVSIERDGDLYRVHTSSGEELVAAAVLVTSPARHSASVIAPLSDTASQGLALMDHASVAMAILRVDARPLAPFAELSGYLVPKPDQQHVTAVSFASNKWAHWRPTDGSHILRVSIGRDGADETPVRDWTDDAIVGAVVAEIKNHTGVSLTPTESRVVRWIESFPQYRPGHLRRLDAIEAALAIDAPGVVLAGASHRGIGIPACVAQAESAAETIAARLGVLRQ